MGKRVFISAGSRCVRLLVSVYIYLGMDACSGRTGVDFVSASTKLRFPRKLAVRACGTEADATAKHIAEPENRWRVKGFHVTPKNHFHYNAKRLAIHGVPFGSSILE